METNLEWVITHSYKSDMISYLAAHPEDFVEAIELALSDKQPYSWRAAWLLWSSMKANDTRLQKYVKRIIETIPNMNEDQQRELLIILQRMEIKEELEGLLFSYCVTVWEKISNKPSVRYNAFKAMVKIARNHPDLSQETILLTQNQYMDSLSSTVKKSVSKMIKEIVF